MEDLKLIAGIILGGGDRLYTRNDYIQFAYIGGGVLIPDYHFKVLQADGKLEGFGQDIGEQIDIINIDIEGVEIPQVDVFGPEYFDGPEVQVDVFGPEYLNPDGEDYRYTVYYDPPGDPTGFNTYYQYYDSNGNKLGIGGEERDGVVDLSLQSTIDYINNAFDEWYERNTRTPLLTYKYTVLYDPPSNDTGINIYYQSYDENGNKIGVGGEENSDGYIDLSLQSTYEYVNNAFDEWYQANTGEPTTDAVEVTSNAATYTFTQDSELYVCYVYLQLRDAPLGSSITANVYNTSISGSPTILDSILTVPAGQTRSNPVALSQTQFSNGDVLQVAILSVGSEFPGAGMQLFLGRKYGEGEEIDWERVGLVNTGNGYVAVFKRPDKKYMFLDGNSVEVFDASDVITPVFTYEVNGFTRSDGGNSDLIFMGKNMILMPEIITELQTYFGSGSVTPSEIGYSDGTNEIDNPAFGSSSIRWEKESGETTSFAYIDEHDRGLLYAFTGQIPKPPSISVPTNVRPSQNGSLDNTPVTETSSHGLYSHYFDGSRKKKVGTASVTTTTSMDLDSEFLLFEDNWGVLYDNIDASYSSSFDSLYGQFVTITNGGVSKQLVKITGSCQVTITGKVDRYGLNFALGTISSNTDYVLDIDKPYAHSDTPNIKQYNHSLSIVYDESGQSFSSSDLPLFGTVINRQAESFLFIESASNECSLYKHYDATDSNPVGAFTRRGSRDSSIHGVDLCTKIGNILYRRKHYQSGLKYHEAFVMITNLVDATLFNSNNQNINGNWWAWPAYPLRNTGFRFKNEPPTEIFWYVYHGTSGDMLRRKTHPSESVETFNFPSTVSVFRIANGETSVDTASVTSSTYTYSVHLEDYEEIMLSENNNKVDAGFYLWQNIYPVAKIVVPFDDHSSSIARYLTVYENRKNANLYTVTDDQSNETVELAISEQKPSNNNFGGAVLLEGQNVSVRGNNYGADWQGTLSEPSLSPPTQSVWYKWVAPSSTPVTIHTLGSPVAADYQVDTVIGVYTGSSLDNLSLVASNDDASVELPPNGDYLSAVVINPTEGTTYYIQVDGYSDTQWSFVLSITTEGLNVPTPIQEETRRADIYRFDTQSLKWKRMPNARSVVSPLTAESDFVSYHATPQTEALDVVCPEE